MAYSAACLQDAKPELFTHACNPPLLRRPPCVCLGSRIGARAAGSAHGQRVRCSRMGSGCTVPACCLAPATPQQPLTTHTATTSIGVASCRRTDQEATESVELEYSLARHEALVSYPCRPPGNGRHTMVKNYYRYYTRGGAIANVRAIHMP